LGIRWGGVTMVQLEVPKMSMVHSEVLKT
jgi:hypothetical protein